MQIAGVGSTMIAPPPPSLHFGGVARPPLPPRPALVVPYSPQLQSQLQTPQSVLQLQQPPLPPTAGTAQPTSALITQQDHSTPSAAPTSSTLLTSTSTSSSSVPNHQPTSAVSAVTEMLKRKLQQRLLAETAKKRRLAENGTGGDDATSGVDGLSSGTGSGLKTADFVVDVWNKNAILNRTTTMTPSAVQLPPNPITSSAAALFQQLPCLPPMMMTPLIGDGQRLPFIAQPSPNLTSVTTTAAASVTTPILNPSVTDCKAKKKSKKRTGKAATGDKLQAGKLPDPSFSNRTAFPTLLPPTCPVPPVVSGGALLAGTCAPILTLPNGNLQPLTSTSVAAAAAAATAVFESRKASPIPTTSGPASVVLLSRHPAPTVGSPTHRLPIGITTSPMARMSVPCPTTVDGGALITFAAASDVSNSINRVSSMIAEAEMATVKSEVSSPLITSSNAAAAETSSKLVELKTEAAASDVDSKVGILGDNLTVTEQGRNTPNAQSTSNSTEVAATTSSVTTGSHQQSNATSVAAAHLSLTDRSGKSRKPSAQCTVASGSLLVASGSPSTLTPCILTTSSETPIAATSAAAASKLPSKVIKFHEYKGPSRTTTSSASICSTATSLTPAAAAAGNSCTSPSVTAKPLLQPIVRLSPLPPMQLLVRSGANVVTSAAETGLIGAAAQQPGRFDKAAAAVAGSAGSCHAAAVTTTGAELTNRNQAPPPLFTVGVVTSQTSAAEGGSASQGGSANESSRFSANTESGNVTSCQPVTSNSNVTPNPTSGHQRLLSDARNSSDELDSSAQNNNGHVLTEVTSPSGSSCSVGSVRYITPVARHVPVSGVPVRPPINLETCRAYQFSEDKLPATSGISSLPSRSPSGTLTPPALPELRTKSPARSNSTPSSDSVVGKSPGTPSATTTPAYLEDVRVSDLKAECRLRRLAVSGPKPNLIARLRPFADEILSRMNGTGSCTATPVTAVELAPVAGVEVVDNSNGVASSSQLSSVVRTLGVPAAVAGASPVTSFHPLIQCSALSPSTSGRSNRTEFVASSSESYQSPVKALFSSPMRSDTSVSTSFPLVFTSTCPPTESSKGPASAAAAADGTSLLSPLFQMSPVNHVNGFFSALNAEGNFCSPSILPGFSGAIGCQQFTTTERQSAPLIGFHSPTAAKQSPFDANRLIDGTLCMENMTHLPQTACDVAALTVDNSDERNGINIDLASLSSLASVKETKEIEFNIDDDEALRQAFDDIGDDFLADMVDIQQVKTADEVGDRSSTTATTVDGLDGNGRGLPTERGTDLVKLPAADVSVTTPEALLDWQRQQIRQLQALLEQSRMELIKTQVKVQRHSATTASKDNMLPNGAVITGNVSTTGSQLSPSCGDCKTNSSTSSALPSLDSIATAAAFLMPMTVKEPPKYDDVIKSKQQVVSIASSTYLSKTQASHCSSRSSNAEDILDFLTNNQHDLSTSFGVQGLESYDQLLSEQPTTSQHASGACRPQYPLNHSAAGTSSQHHLCPLPPPLQLQHQQQQLHPLNHAQTQGCEVDSARTMQPTLPYLVPSPSASLTEPTSITAGYVDYVSSSSSSGVSSCPSMSMTSSPLSASSSATDCDAAYLQQCDSATGSNTPWSVAPNSVEADDLLVDHFSSASSTQSSSSSLSSSTSGFSSSGSNLSSGPTSRRPFQTGCVKFVDEEWTSTAAAASILATSTQVPVKVESEVDGQRSEELGLVRMTNHLEAEFPCHGRKKYNPKTAPTYGCSDPCLSSAVSLDDFEMSQHDGDDNDVDDCLDFTDLLDMIAMPSSTGSDVAVDCVSGDGIESSLIIDSGCSSTDVGHLSQFGHRHQRLQQRQRSCSSSLNVLDELFELEAACYETGNSSSPVDDLCLPMSPCLVATVSNS